MGKKTEPKPDWHEKLHGHKPEDVIEALELALRYAQTVAGATERCRTKLCRSEGRCHMTIEPDTGDGICPAGLRNSEFESAVLMLGFLAEVWRVKVGRAPPRPGEFERRLEQRAREEAEDPEKALMRRADWNDRMNGWGKYCKNPEATDPIPAVSLPAWDEMLASRPWASGPRGADDPS